MLLAIDIGNTNVTVGVYDDKTLTFTARIATDLNRTGDQYAVELMGIFQLYHCDVAALDGAIVSSVSPAVTQPICRAVGKVTGLSPMIVGPGMKTGLNIAINDPAELGADLLACRWRRVPITRFPMQCVIWEPPAPFPWWTRTER